MSGPSDQQLFTIATQHHQAGRLEEAHAIYADLLARNPRQPDLLHMLGVLAMHRGDAPRAVELIEQAIAIAPNQSSYHGNLGMALTAARRIDEAIAVFGRAIALKSDYPEAYHNLGAALKSKREFDKAATAFARSAALRPDSYDTWFQLSDVLRENLDFAGALNSAQKAVQLRPDSVEAQARLGDALYDVGRADDSITAFGKALDLRPNEPNLLFSLGTSCLGRGLLDEAEKSLRLAIDLKPDYADAYVNLGQVLKEAGRPGEAIDAFRRSMGIRHDPRVADNILFTMNFVECSSRQLAEEHSGWNREFAKPLSRLIRPHENDRDPRRQLRIGYISPDFRNHSVGRFMLPLLTGHARGAFEIFCYSDVRQPDAFTSLLASRAGAWRPTARMSDEELAAMIRADHIDVLVDLALHTAHNRLLVFARKPSPVQVTYLAYCGTSGLDAMDYRLTDPYLDPPGMEDPSYSERSFRLPRTYWCYRPPDDAPAIGPLPASGSGYVTFGCLNTFCKVSPPTLQTWIRLMKAVAGSRLILHALDGSHRDRMRELIAREGIDPSRLEFSGYLSIDTYYKLYRRIDIALDPFPYAGGTTTCDSLWMGVPVVTLAGERAISRGGVSILSNIGLPELIAQSSDEYVGIASRLAADIPRLSNLRSSMRERMSISPLMNADQFTKDVEAAYRQMWLEWCARR